MQGLTSVKQTNKQTDRHSLRYSGCRREHKAMFPLLLHSSIIILSLLSLLKVLHYLWDLTHFSFSRTAGVGRWVGGSTSAFWQCPPHYFQREAFITWRKRSRNAETVLSMPSRRSWAMWQAPFQHQVLSTFVCDRIPWWRRRGHQAYIGAGPKRNPASQGPPTSITSKNNYPKPKTLVLKLDHGHLSSQRLLGFTPIV